MPHKRRDDNMTLHYQKSENLRHYSVKAQKSSPILTDSDSVVTREKYGLIEKAKQQVCGGLE